MNIGDKIRSARKIKGFTQGGLADLLCRLGGKVTGQQVSSWERGDYAPNHRNLINLCEILGMSFERLMEGGESLLSHDEGNLPDGFTLVEKKKGAISAGHGLARSDEVDFRLAFREDWLNKFGGSEQLFVMRVEGDSMEPTLMENDVVLINKNARDINAGGGIYAINWKGALLVKRMQFNPQSGEIKIKSDNPQYDSLIVNPADIQVEGKVIWYGREMR